MYKHFLLCHETRSLLCPSFILSLVQHKSRGRNPPGLEQLQTKRWKVSQGESGSSTLLMQKFLGAFLLCSGDVFCFLFVYSLHFPHKEFETKSLKKREGGGTKIKNRITTFHPTVGFKSVACAEARRKCSDFWIISPSYSHNSLLCLLMLTVVMSEQRAQSGFSRL